MLSADFTGFGAHLAVLGLCRDGAVGCRPDASPEVVRPGPFERLIEIARSNDLLLAQLTEARRRQGQAERYAADPESRGDLAGVLVAHARRRRDEIQGRLAANRAEAIALLAGRAAAP